MYSLNVIKKINAERGKAPARESETTRHCSHCVSVTTVKGRPVRNVVLHSAKHRNTAFITGHTANRFLTELQATNSDTKRDTIIEAYFNAVPTGKQSIAA